MECKCDYSFLLFTLIVAVTFQKTSTYSPESYKNPGKKEDTL